MRRTNKRKTSNQTRNLSNRLASDVRRMVARGWGKEKAIKFIISSKKLDASQIAALYRKLENL